MALASNGADNAASLLYKTLRPGFANGSYGHEALGSVKVAAAVSQKAASYMMELAHHAQKNAAELDKARRAVEKYIIGTDVDTISDADPFISGTDVPTPQEYSQFTFPTNSLGELEAGQQAYGKGSALSQNPPYLMEDVSQMPGMQPSRIPVGGTAGKNAIPLSTPADMDGHFLQKFDNSLARAGERGKDEMLKMFM